MIVETIKRWLSLCEQPGCWRLAMPYVSRNPRERALMDRRRDSAPMVDAVCTPHGAEVMARLKTMRDRAAQSVSFPTDRVCALCAEAVVGRDRITDPMKGVFHPECYVEARKAPGFYDDHLDQMAAVKVPLAVVRENGNE